MKLIKFAAIALLMAFISLSYSTAQGFTNLSECLVTNDIGKFTYRLRNARLGNACGVVGGADHFKVDHVDSICNGRYSNLSEIRGLPLEEAEEKSLSVKVEVTQHTGGDSDRWLLHELDAEFRTYYGIPGLSFTIKSIDGNSVYVFAAGGRDYRWISGNKVIRIDYTALQMSTKPEPLEIVKAYLAKHPSSMQPTTLLEFRGNANVTKWIKDEIDRRLWLCDKWNAQFQAGGVTQADLIYNLARSMGVFINYRQKYFGVAAEADLKLLSGYQQNKDIASIQTKLSEYKGWWSTNKARSISLP